MLDALTDRLEAAVQAFDLTNTRSMATASGRCRDIQASISAWRASSRRGVIIAAGVRMTATSTIRTERPGAPSTTPIPQRVRPGTTPRTRITSASLYTHLHQRNRTPFGADAPCGWAPFQGTSLVVVQLLEDLVADVAVGVDVLDAVAVLEGRR